MKIIFLNIANFEFGTAGIKKFLVEHLETTDIFCLQECPNSLGIQIRKKLKDFSIFSTSKSSKGEPPYTNCTIIKNKYHVESVVPLMLEKPNLGIGFLTTLRIKGKNLNIINIHGVAYPGTKMDNQERLEQSNIIINSLNKLSGPKVIGGDFNLLPSTKSIKVFENSRYKNLIKDFKIKSTRNEIAWKKYPTDKQFFADYVFTDSKIKVKSFKVPYNEISDHLPMILEFEL